MQASPAPTLSIKQVLFCGAMIVTLSMGIRHGFGLWLQPITQAQDWSRQAFSFALAVQNLSAAPAIPPTAGAVYKTGGHTFTVVDYVASAKPLVIPHAIYAELTSDTAFVQIANSGTLALDSGTGSALIAYTAYGSNGGIRRMANGVHAAIPGYQQEADGDFSFLKCTV